MHAHSDISGGPAKEVKVPKGPPPHPGTVLAKHTIPSLKMTPRDFSAAIGIKHDRLEQLLCGSIALDEDLREKMRGVLGDGTDTLYALQAAYDHFKATGKIPPPNVPSKSAARIAVGRLATFG